MVSCCLFLSSCWMKMETVISIFLLFCLFLLSPYPSSSLPLCNDLRAPVIPKTPLSFCKYEGSACCNSTEDLQLQKQFEAMNISDSGCAAAVKSVLCATCDPFAAELFRVASGLRSVPVLCNSTVSAASSLLGQTAGGFCSAAWDACQDISILNSPFVPSLQIKPEVVKKATPSKLTDLWQSRNDFCKAFGGASDENSLCYNGGPISLNTSETLASPKGMCLEKVGNGSYINVVAHPDGSNRAFFSDQPGKIWLATIPEQDSGETFGLDESSPFVDLTDQVYLDTSCGMMGMAFHLNFAQNGRFFVSFNCDKVKTQGCGGRCACNSDVNCDPSKLGSSNGAQPCQYHAVVAEYSANGTASDPSKANLARPSEVRKIMTIGLPYKIDHGGQILFGPSDGYLYVMMGDGGSKGDPYNFAQNKRSLLGKIMRLDVDKIPSAKEIVEMDRWGNYSIPEDNPYIEDKELQPEIWALGFRNPRRCSFDADRPSYFLCADVGEDQYEEVDIITKGGNYGWRVYEGPIAFKPQQTPGGNTSADSIEPIFPVVGYRHSEVHNKEGYAAITGGFFYRSTTDPCIHGSYLYGDLDAVDMWAAAETPKNSGNFTTTKIPFSCAHDSPIKCSSVPNSPLPALGNIFSFGQDNRKDVFILTSSGVYRVVRPSRCNYSCSKEKVAIAPKPIPPSSRSRNLKKPQKVLLLFLFLLLLSIGCLL